MLGADSARADVIASRIVAIQRDPQPDEAEILDHTEIRFALVDLDADPYDPVLSTLNFTVMVEGALALDYTGGVATFHGAWIAGSITPLAVPHPFTGVEVVMAQAAPPLFSSLQLVDVAVEGNVSLAWGHAAEHFLWQWQFTVQDLTAPEVGWADPRSSEVVRVAFLKTILGVPVPAAMATSCSASALRPKAGSRPGRSSG